MGVELVLCSGSRGASYCGWDAQVHQCALLAEAREGLITRGLPGDHDARRGSPPASRPRPLGYSDPEELDGGKHPAIRMEAVPYV